MRPIMIVPALALLLAACGGETAKTESNVVAVNNDAEANAIGNGAAAENVTARIVAMSDRERNVVFVRALMDAGIPCDGVTGSQRLEDQDGKPVWRADCKGAPSHLISITPDGTAHIVSRSDR